MKCLKLSGYNGYDDYFYRLDTHDDLVDAVKSALDFYIDQKTQDGDVNIEDGFSGSFELVELTEKEIEEIDWDY